MTTLASTQNFGPLTISGYDGASSTPVGTVVESVHYVEPGHYGIAARPGSETYRDTLAASIAAHEQAEIDNRASRSGEPEGIYLPLPENFVIDVRWTMSHPTADGRGRSKTDTVMSRTRYSCLDEARAHLARLDKYGSQG